MRRWPFALVFLWLAAAGCKSADGDLVGIWSGHLRETKADSSAGAKPQMQLELHADHTYDISISLGSSVHGQWSVEGNKVLLTLDAMSGVPVPGDSSTADLSPDRKTISDQDVVYTKN